MIGTTYYWDVFTAEEPPIFIHTIPLKFRDYSYLDIQNEDHQRDYLRGRFGMFFVQSTLG